MKILLIGEYSRLHNSLKEGLISLDNDVTLMADGDVFKNYPRDINIGATICQSTIILKALRHFLYHLTFSKWDLYNTERIIRFYNKRHIIKDYDIIQVINEIPFGMNIWFLKRFWQYLFNHNNNVHLLCCSDDYLSTSYQLTSKDNYNILSAYKNSNKNDHDRNHSFKYVMKPYKKLHDFIYKNIISIIPTDFDYAPAVTHLPKGKPLIPNPINIDKIDFTELKTDDKIVIFHGVNKLSKTKKGSQYFLDALEIIKEKYDQKIEVITTNSLPYDVYINKYNKAHILLDQVFSHDQGYNALEAMAKGKVVFTGVEKIFVEHYKLEKTVAINAVPDVDQLVNDLEDLILNPEKIKEIGKNAREFIKKEHHYIEIAKKYLNSWSNV